MKKIFVGMLILMAMVSVSGAAVITGVTAEATDYYEYKYDPYAMGAVSGEPNAVTNSSGFNEALGWHYNDGLRGTVVDEVNPSIVYQNGPATMWIASMDPLPSITFDLGAAQRVTRIRVWNANSVGNTVIHSQHHDLNNVDAKVGRLNMGVKTMDIFLLADDGTTVLDSFTAVPLDRAPGLADVDFGQDIDITDTDAVRYIRFDIKTNYGDTAGQVGLSEVRFYDDDTTVIVDAGPDQNVEIGSGGADPNVLVSLEGEITGLTGGASWFLYGSANVFPRDLADPNVPAIKDPNVVLVSDETITPHPTDPDVETVTATAAIRMPGIYDFGLIDSATGILDLIRVRVFASSTDEGLIGHWKLDEVPDPESPFPFKGYGVMINEVGGMSMDEYYDGTLNETTTTNGKITGSLADTLPAPNQADAVDGTSFLYSRAGSIQVPDPEMEIEYPVDDDPSDHYFSMQTVKEMTYSAWYKVYGTLPTPFDDVAEATLALMDKGTLIMWTVNDQIHFRFILTQVDQGGYYVGYRGIGKTKITDGQWHHVALSYDGFSIKLYVDGRLDAEVFAYDRTEIWDPGTSEQLMGQPLRIGARSNDTLSFVGYIDDVKMYRVAKDQDWAISEYESAGLGSACTTLLLGDLDDDCDSDIDDLILLAQDWLK